MIRAPFASPFAPAIRFCAVVGLACLAGCAAEENPEMPDLAIVDVTVIDAVNGVRPAQTILIRNDTILAVLDVDATPVADAIAIGTGLYVIPGLWDMHVHLTYDPALTDAMAGLFIRWGITSVRDTGGQLERILPVVEAMRAPDAVAPRVFFAGPLMDGSIVVYDGDGRPEIGIGNASVDEARARVTTLADAGVDFIKIYEMVSPEIFDAIATAATERGLPIAAHVPLSMRARMVGPRVGSMEHLRNIEMDCAASPDSLLSVRQRELAASSGEAGADLRTRLHGMQRLPAIAAYDAEQCAQVLATLASTIQVPTLRLNSFALHPAFAEEGWFDAVAQAPDSIARAWTAAGDAFLADRPTQDTTFASWSLRLVGDMHARGIPIGAGTDTPINYSLPGFALHTELELLVQAGLTPLEAIAAATLRPAEFFGLESEMGQIAPGMRADLVLLQADPIGNIQNTRRIAGVVSHGRLLSTEDLEDLVR